MGRKAMRCAVAAATAVLATVAAQPAAAGHTIWPGYYPSHLNPSGTLHWGIPGPDALASNAFSSCTSGTQVGTRDVGNYVNYWWGSRRTDYYNCRGTSLHGEGRALDYFVNKNISSEKAIGDAIFAFWQKSDAGAVTYMPMRRFGIQTVIWNCRIYSSSDMTIRTYFRCDPNHPDHSTNASYRHEDHVHIDLNWAGARRQRTAWTGYQPCYDSHTGCPVF